MAFYSVGQKTPRFSCFFQKGGWDGHDIAVSALAGCDAPRLMVGGGGVRCEQ